MLPKSQWPNYNAELLLKITDIFKSSKTNYLADKTIAFLVDDTITKKDIVHTCDVLKKEINNLI